jgi:hypothetical protein
MAQCNQETVPRHMPEQTHQRQPVTPGIELATDGTYATRRSL